MKPKKNIATLIKENKIDHYITDDLFRVIKFMTYIKLSIKYDSTGDMMRIYA